MGVSRAWLHDVAWLLVSVMEMACGGPESHMDAEQGCQLPPGRSFAQRISIAGPGIGFDLNGDGVVDNAWGNLPPALLDNINRDLQRSFLTGNTVLVSHIASWTDPPTADDPDLAAYVVLGVDADSNLENNFDGTGTFLATPSSFDLNCNPSITMDRAWLTDGTLHVTSRSLVLPFVGFQTVEYQNVQGLGTFDADFMSYTFVNGGTLPFCSLATTKLSGQSMLELFVSNQAQTGVYPDIDLDGDGLERVVSDGSNLECIDGDGVTTISGADCACDPRMQDGYSFAVVGDSIFVRMVGIR